MKFALMPTVNQRYKIIKTILRDKLFGTEMYSLKNEAKNKIKIPTTKENFIMPLIGIIDKEINQRKR